MLLWPRMTGLPVLQHLAQPQALTLTVEPQADGPERVEILEGRTDLVGVARVLDTHGRGDLLTRAEDGAWLLSSILEVGQGAELEVNGGTLRLLSDPDRIVALEARGGTLSIHDSLVTSWDPAAAAPDADASDGRAWVLASDGARMIVDGARMEQLGYDAPQRSGVSWLGTGTGGGVNATTFTGNHDGVYTEGVERLQLLDSVFERSRQAGLHAGNATRGLSVRDSVFRDNGAHGVLLAPRTAAVVLEENRSYDNRLHGIAIVQADGPVLSRNEVDDNALSGIEVGGSAAPRLSENLVYGNRVGVSLSAGTDDAELAGNRISANRTDGVQVALGATLARMSGNIVDLNQRSGVYLADATAAVDQGNELLRNGVGLWLADDVGQARVIGNLIASNVEDGVRLAGSERVQVAENTISDNGDAAFSVAGGQSAEGFVAQNEVGEHPRGSFRTRT
jgi:parallel beta-helix repeat protein